MTNLETLTTAGVVPPDHTLTDDDKKTIEGLSAHEVQVLVGLKDKLGTEFIHRNTRDAANCIL
ncbi:MAG TPA: hypothetical protein VG273_14585 [Bryobacteraceae bacterium]|nr:hypothetical protein [Bryobacteraceae bacterium]